MKRHPILSFLLFALSLAACADSGNDRPDPAVESVTGVVSMVREHEGTFSEIRYFALLSTSGKRLILFNDRGYSLGFDDWLDKEVEIRYLPREGKIGPRRTPAQGIEVLDIREME